MQMLGYSFLHFFLLTTFFVSCLMPNKLNDAINYPIDRNLDKHCGMLPFQILLLRA